MDELGAANTVFSKREGILEEIATIYTQNDVGLIAISKHPSVSKLLNRKIFQPQKKVIVLIVGGHSTGKSSFANWFFGDNIQKVSAAIETSKITFITTGRKRQSFDGTSTLRLFDFLSDYKSIPHFVDNLNTEMRLPVRSRSNLVTFIDTPGLIPDQERLPFDCEQIMLKLVNHSQEILVFMDPIGQAFSGPLRDFVRQAHSEYGNRMHFFLTKSDTIDEEERNRIISSISQTLSNTITKRTLDVRPIWLTKESDDGDREDKTNALSHICELIENAVNNTVQSNRSQLEKDLKDVTRAAETALKSLETRRRRFYLATLLFSIATAYFVAALKVDQVHFFKGLHYVVLVLLLVFLFTLWQRPSSMEIRKIRAFLDSTARTAKIKLNQFFTELNDENS